MQLLVEKHIFQYNRSKTLAAIARRYLARTAPGAEAHSLPLFLERALRAAATASSTSSAVAAGISPKPQYKKQKEKGQFITIEP